LGNLFQDFLSDGEIIEQCKKRLRSEPILNKNTRSSFAIDVQNQRVDYKIEDKEWRVWQDFE